MKNVFIHHVFFWLNNPKDEKEYQQLKKGIESLEKIKSLKSFHLGIPASTDRPVIDRSYNFSLLTIFDSKEKHDEYQVDAIHTSFVEKHKHLWKKVLIYDSID